MVGRLIAQQLTERLGRQIIVDNRSGAGGVVGTELASQAPKDGYTLLIISIAHAVNPWLYDLKGRYDPLKSFTPIAVLASGPNVLVVNPNYPAKDVKELIALAKKSPGKVGWATAGVGSFQHLGGALFEVQAGVKFLHVPFKGGGPAMIDVVAGHNPVMFSSLVQTTPQIQSGKLRALGVGGTQAEPDPARRSDHRRSRRTGLRSDQLVGYRGAGRGAAGGRRPAAHGDRGGADREAGPGGVRQGRRRRAPDEPGRVRRLHGVGNGQVGEGRQGKRHEGR